MRVECNWCSSEVIGFQMISEEVFTEQGVETIRNSAVLSCGCRSDFARYNIDPEEGWVEIEDMVTESPMIEWEEPRLSSSEEEGDDPWL